MTYVSTIRNKGQITIPDKIRNDLSWLNTGSVVHIIPLNDQSVVLRPYSHDETQEKTNWKKIWDLIALARSFKGKKGNLAAFIARDRETH